MRFLSALLAIGALAATGLAGARAQTLTLGSPTGGNCVPFGCNLSGITSGTSIQYLEIYSGSAFTGPTTFDAITFTQIADETVPDSLVSGTYSISFATTTEPLGTDYADLYDALSDTKTFFSGCAGAGVGCLGTQSGSTFTITGTPYAFDPTAGENLVMVVTASQGAAPPGDTANYFMADEDNTSVSRAYYFNTSDYFSYDTDDTDYGLVTTFTLGGDAAPEPAAWTLLLTGVGLAGAAVRRRRELVAARITP